MSDLEQSESLLNVYHAEYVRLNDRMDELIDSSFEDFKLLAAIGALIAWPPISNMDWFGGGGSGAVLFMGFVAILFIIIIIAVRDILKMAIVDFYTQEMRAYEDEFKACYDNAGSTFQLAHHMPSYLKAKHMPIFRRFALLFIILLLGFPTAVLIAHGDVLFAGLYLVIFLGVFWIYLQSGSILGWN